MFVRKYIHFLGQLFYYYTIHVTGFASAKMLRCSYSLLLLLSFSVLRKFRKKTIKLKHCTTYLSCGYFQIQYMHILVIFPFSIFPYIPFLFFLLIFSILLSLSLFLQHTISLYLHNYLSLYFSSSLLSTVSKPYFSSLWSICRPLSCISFSLFLYLSLSYLPYL